MNITNTTIFTNVTRIEHLVQTANTISDGAFLGAIMMALFFIVWFMIPADFARKSLVAFWFSFILSVILRAGGLIGWSFVTIFFLGSIMTYLYLMFVGD